MLWILRGILWLAGGGEASTSRFVLISLHGPGQNSECVSIASHPHYDLRHDFLFFPRLAAPYLVRTGRDDDDEFFWHRMLGAWV